MMTRENGHCPVTGRVAYAYLSKKDDPAMVDSPQLAHIISQPILQGIIGELGDAQKKV